MELVYLLASLEDKYNPNSIYLKYLVKRQVIYLNSRKEYERIKQINPNLTTVSGLGFILIKMEVYKKYHYNEHILNYHATKLLEEIFYNNENREYNFEEFIHIKYSNPEVIKKIGIRTFIIDYVFNYDRCLGDYIAVNIDLIKNIEKKLKDIIDNYKQYEYNLILTKNFIFEEKALNIINDNLSYLSLEEICYYIYKEKNIKIAYLNELCLELEEFNEYNLTFLDRKTINEILKLAKEIYDKNTTITKLNMMEEYKYIEEKCESKVLEFKPNKSIGNS